MTRPLHEQLDEWLNSPDFDEVDRVSNDAVRALISQIRTLLNEQQGMRNAAMQAGLEERFDLIEVGTDPAYVTHIPGPKFFVNVRADRAETTLRTTASLLIQWRNIVGEVNRGGVFPSERAERLRIVESEMGRVIDQLLAPERPAS